MFKGSKLSSYRVRKVVECFCLDLTATQTARLLKLNRKTVNALYQRFRLLICLQRMNERRAFRGVVEVDECYFGASRVRGRARPRLRGRGTLKQPVFGIFERQGEVYTEIINDCSAYTLRSIIRGGSTRRASSAPMAGPVTMAWSMSVTTSTCASTSKGPLPTAALISTASKPSGASLSAVWPSSTESKPTLIFISRSASGATTNLLPSYSKTS